ncbi:hypothetical protein ACFLY3_00580 [Chloroflexota bacterium]
MNGLSGSLGDIFWDLPSSVLYSPGMELGCTIYVANPTEQEKEYALISRLSADGLLISEESVTVFGCAWFKVEPGDFIKLHGALQFEDSNTTLEVLLIERESGEAADSVAAYLVSPETALNTGWPIGWPGGTTVAEADTGWLTAMMMLMMMGLVAGSIAAPKEEEKLAQGRYD